VTEAELQAYLKQQFPRENERCEWKAFTNLKHAVSAHPGEDVISYVSVIANVDCRPAGPRRALAARAETKRSDPVR
jgi:hypothetical protein